MIKIKYILLIGGFLMIGYLMSCFTHRKAEFNGNKITHLNPVTIHFLGHWLHEGKREELVRNVTREYEFRHQEVKIDLRFPDEIYYHREDPLSNQKFVASIIKKENPEWDIIRLNNEYEAINDVTKDPLWAKKSLVDFSEIEDFKKNTLPTLISDSVKKLWGGIIPGPFLEGVSWALWCNNAVASKIGIKVKQFDMTSEDFLGYIKAAAEYNKTHNNEVIPIFESVDWKTVCAISSQLFISELGDNKDLFSDAVSEKKLKAWQKTLDFLEELSAFKPLSDKLDTMHWEKGKNIILADKCLFFSNGSWMYNIWLSVNPEKLRNIMPAEYPVFKSTNLYLTSYQIVWGVLKNAPHREEAIKFLLSWNSPLVADSWTRYTKCTTGIKGSFSDVTFGKDQFELYSNHISHKYGTKNYNLTANSMYILGTSRRSTPNYYEDVLLGKISANTAMKKIRSTVNR